MVEIFTIIFKAVTAYLKALIVVIKKVDKEVNIQVEIEDNKQSNLSESKALDKDIGIDIGNIMQLIKQSFQYKYYKISQQSLNYIKLKLYFINIMDNAA